MRISDWSSDVCSSDLQTAILGFPVVDRRFRHAVATSQVDSLRASLLLLQHADDLLFCEPCSLHSSVLPSGQTLIKLGGKSGGQVILKQIQMKIIIGVLRPGVMMPILAPSSEYFMEPCMSDALAGQEIGRAHV